MENMATTQERLSVLHELCYCVLSISNAFLKLRCNESSGFGEMSLRPRANRFRASDPAYTMLIYGGPKQAELPYVVQEELVCFPG